MADLIQIRRDSYENWYSVNPTLELGEIGLVVSSGSIPYNPLQCKVGNGSTSWRNLPMQAWAEPGLSGSLSATDEEIKERADNVESHLGYITCGTAAGTAAKTADDYTILPNYEITKNVRLLIRMNAANTAAGVTLDVNSTGAKTLLYNGSAPSSTNTWAAGEVLDVYYNGTAYVASTYGGAQFATGQKVGNISISGSTGYSSGSLMSQKAITEELDSIKEVVFPLTLTFTSSATQLEFTGAAQTVTLSWTVKRNGVAVTPTALSINGTTITPASSGNYTGTIEASTLGGTTFILSATAEGITKTASVTVTTILPMWVGFYASGSTAATMISGSGALTKKVVSSVASLSGTYNNTSATKYLTLLTPSGKNITKITSSGFDVPMQTAVSDSTIKIPAGGTSRTYNVYRSADPINPGDMTISVS